jgi:hypothetical protein
MISGTHVRHVPDRRQRGYDRSVTDDLGDQLSDRERARIRSRDRKVRGPRVVVDNPGLKKLTVELARKRRAPRPSGKS